MSRFPCHTCRRVHRPPACTPDEPRSVSRYVSLPAHVNRELVARTYWGERSGFIAAAVEAALDRLAEREEAA